MACSYFANAPKSTTLWTTRVGVLRLTGQVVLAADLRGCVTGRTVTTDGSRFPLRPLESRTLLITECTHTSLPGLYPYLGSQVAPGRLLII